MGNLDNLIEKFKPQRAFSCSYGRVEVDGVLVRVAKEGEESWRLFSDETGRKYYAIAVEDLLQDPAIIRSARVSTDRDSKEVDEKAVGLIQALWREKHLTPSEGGVVFRLRFEVPISYAQPLFRLFASFNEFSGRYSVIDGEYYTPLNLSAAAFQEFQQAEEEARSTYKKLLELGVAREMARFAHLYRFYTKFYMTISLRHILEFLSWTNVHTRHIKTEFWEIQNVFREIIQCWTPWAFEAFEGTANSINFSWINEQLKKNKKSLVELPSERTVKILDHGLIRIMDSFGNQDLITSCLNDFPNPLRALGHGGMTFLIKMPIFVFRQWVRHRNGAMTELKSDYDIMVERDSFYLPERFRKQTGKAMSYQYADMDDGENETVKKIFVEHKEIARRRYERLRHLGISGEVAAMILPYNFYVFTVWTASLESLINFIHLRTDIHAQFEIRQYAKIIADMVRDHFPDIAKLYNEGKI